MIRWSVERENESFPLQLSRCYFILSNVLFATFTSVEVRANLLNEYPDSITQIEQLKIFQKTRNRF